MVNLARVQAGVHFLQEHSPDEIGYALAEWLMGLTP